MSLHRSTQIPFQCPKCGAQKGFPIGLAVEKDTAVAVIRCKRCENMWQMQRKAGAAWPHTVAASTS